MFQLRLKEIRELRGLSQQALADGIGEAQSTVGCWESGRGKPRYRTLIRLADYLNVSLDYLTGRGNQMDIKPDLSSEESKVINAFRGLSPVEKAMVRRMLNILDD